MRFFFFFQENHQLNIHFDVNRPKLTKKYAQRVVLSKQPVACKLCKFNDIECIISRSENLKRHLTRKHKDFIRMRANKHDISFNDSLIKTISEHICNGLDIPQELLPLSSELSLNSVDKESSIFSNKASDGSLDMKKLFNSNIELTGNTNSLNQAEATNENFKVIQFFFIIKYLRQCFI